jgi:hypothetical protein
MLRIRKEQMDLLDAHMMRVYERRVVRKIKQTFPEWYRQEGEDKAHLLVQAGIRKAEGYRITEDDDVERFILLLVPYGLAFEEKPERSECREILEDQDLPGDAKVAMVSEELESEGNVPGGTGSLEV